MSLFQNPLLARIAQTDPALARAGEIGLYALIAYLLAVLLGQEVFSSQLALAAFLTPLLAYIGKQQRQLNPRA